MNEFYIKESPVINVVNDFGTDADRLKEYASAIEDCRKRMIFGENDLNAQIMRALSLSYKETLNEAAHMNSIRSALDLIVRRYRDTENHILSNATTDAGLEQGYEQKEKTDKRSGWRRFWDWLFGKDVDRKYTHTTDEQEAAADKQMQGQVERLLKQDKYSEAKWKEASIDERKEILNNLLNDVIKIMGLQGISTSINFYNKPTENGLTSMGYYTDGAKRVSINENVIQTMSARGSYQLLRTVVHELRHAYQHEAVHHPDRYQVSKETINAWAESFRTYKEEQAKGYEAYRNIVVEKDARWFAGQD